MIADRAYNRVSLDDLPMLRWDRLNSHGIEAYTTTRLGGVSEGKFESLNMGFHVEDDPDRVLVNRKRVADAIGRSLDDFVFCQQVHLPNVTVVDTDDRGRGAYSDKTAIQETDSLVTRATGVVLAVMLADCVPIILLDPEERILACIHAGWGGTVRGVCRATIQTMQSMGAVPSRIVAALGPAISPESYEVGADVYQLAEAEFAAATPEVLRPSSEGKWLFNLWKANAIQLQSAGLLETNIDIAPLSTGPESDFFSHRFSGGCGRFATLASL